jgi:hypothetical protein
VFDGGARTPSTRSTRSHEPDRGAHATPGAPARATVSALVPSLGALVDPFRLWPRAARLGRLASAAAVDAAARTVVGALDRVPASPRAAEAVDVVLRSPLAERTVGS